jgi:hypothetical protein
MFTNFEDTNVITESVICGGIVKWQKLSQDTDSATAFLGLLGIH